MKIKHMLRASALVLFVLTLLAIISNGSYGTQLAIVPKWGFSIGELEIGAVYLTNGVAHSFTNRISHIGPIIITEFNH
jgi:hypothetical protein